LILLHDRPEPLEQILYLAVDRLGLGNDQRGPIGANRAQPAVFLPTVDGDNRCNQLDQLLHRLRLGRELNLVNMLPSAKSKPRCLRLRRELNLCLPAPGIGPADPARRVQTGRSGTAALDLSRLKLREVNGDAMQLAIHRVNLVAMGAGFRMDLGDLFRG
jgi:hypothetical protein